MNECHNCGESFEPDDSDAGDPETFCSEGCEEDYWYCEGEDL